MTTTSRSAALKPTCVATTCTGETFDSKSNEDQAEDAETGNVQRRSKPSNGFRTAQFSADGTTIVTHNEDNHLRTFILPIDLLDEQSHGLTGHCSLPSPSPLQCFALYPSFDLQDPSTTVALSASKDLPISLTNVIHPGFVHATYPLINPTTEAYIAPNSLAWTRDRSHFIAGSKDQISIFDPSYDGSGPILTHKTAPGRAEKKRFGASGLHSCSGIVSALSISSNGTLACGTTEREVALYAQEGAGERMTSFSLTSPHSGQAAPPKGSGITQFGWSPYGHYLFIAERQSDGIQVYDMRYLLSRVSWLSGRRAQTTQRLSMDIVPTADGLEVWAGGMDGSVRMWDNPGCTSDEHSPDATIKVHDDSVTTAVWHPTGAVLATCSARRFEISHGAEPEDRVSLSNQVERVASDNTLKVWTV